jgi:hypothetical protein
VILPVRAAVMMSFSIYLRSSLRRWADYESYISCLKPVAS